MLTPKESHIEDKNNDTPSKSSPSLLQRIASFIDSPCSGLAISSSTHESPTSSRSTSRVDTKNPSSISNDRSKESPSVVTPIKATRSSRRIRNRSSASKYVRREKINSLLNCAQSPQHIKPSHIQPLILRRTKSLQTTPSPTSVLSDTVFWTDSTDQFETVYCQPIQECCTKAESPDRSTLQDTWTGFSPPGWCCNDLTAAATFDNNNQSLATSRVCDGYIDYVGKHHPHEPTNCQGCIFRQSVFDSGGAKANEELYYDSDYELYSRHHEDDANEVPSTPALRRQSRQSYPPSCIVDDQQSWDATEDSSPDRQAHMYDYFTRSQQLNYTPLRTGGDATSDADVAACVQVGTAVFYYTNLINYLTLYGYSHTQEALNSTWRLSWHTASSTNSKSAFLPHPKPCNVWIERGYRRNVNQAVEPRLMWREAKVHTTYTELMERPNSLSLLAIRRIVPGEQVAESFIFTKANCMIIVKSSLGKDYWFEAASTSARDEVLHLWKMTTARLVSYAATQNTDQMVEEFFNEYSVH